jgi:hypothetical protein
MHSFATTAQDLAEQDPDYRQVKASFALEGIDLTNEDAERAGRFLSGEISLEQGLDEIRRKYAKGDTQSENVVSLVRG